MTESLIHCVYASVAAHEFSPAELEQLLARARKRNSVLNVTGVLLYVEQTFFQVLEGEESSVDGLFERIVLDERHGGVTRIMREPIATRSFEHWSMGHAQVTAHELHAIPGMNGFFTEKGYLDKVGQGRARKLLHAFASGRWRARIDGPPRALRRTG